MVDSMCPPRKEEGSNAEKVHSMPLGAIEKAPKNEEEGMNLIQASREKFQQVQ